MRFIGLAIVTAISTALANAQPDSAVLDAESRRIAVMDRCKDCVLAVFPPDGQGSGSGVVISPDGYALSNFHVVQPCGHAMQCGMADGRVYDAVIVGIDPTGDVALMKLFGRDDFPCATLGDSDRVRTGDAVFAMGNPFMLATDMQPTVTYGIVSGVHRYQFPAGTLLEYADCLQIDASINPGNSGGPLFDTEGQLIGVNGRASFEKRGRVNVGAAYAISINQIKNFFGALGSGRIVDHATLGATVAFDDEGRVVVTDILETSDAYRRGLRYDDEIIRFGGRVISTPNGLKNTLGIFPKGWRVPLSFRHDGMRYDVLVRLAGVHSQAKLIEKTSGRPPVPMPLPQPGEKPKPKPHKVKLPVPEIVKKHFVERRGYANDYFNTLNRQRVWSAWSARANLDGADGVWTLAGQRQLPSPFGRGVGGEGGSNMDSLNTNNSLALHPSSPHPNPLPKGEGTSTYLPLPKGEGTGAHLPSPAGRGAGGEGGGAFRFQLSDNGASLQLPSTEIPWTAGDDLSASLLPADSGGLLPALYLWRRMAVEGCGRFGDVYYYGTAPLTGHEPLADVLIGSHKGVQCRFYFDPAGGHLLAIEMFSDEYGDPCEVYFSEYEEHEGRFWPGRIEVRHGDAPFAVFKVEEADCEK